MALEDSGGHAMVRCTGNFSFETFAMQLSTDPAGLIAAVSNCWRGMARHAGVERNLATASCLLDGVILGHLAI